MPQSIDPLALAALGELCVKHPAFQQRTEGTTFCNLSVATAALFYGYHGLHDAKGEPFLANQMARVLDTDPAWSDVPSWFAAQELANEGRLVVIYNEGQPHGHVCFVVPGKMVQSSNYGGAVPLVANVGPANATKITGLNWAIAASRKPRMKVYEPQEIIV